MTLNAPRVRRVRPNPAIAIGAVYRRYRAKLKTDLRVIPLMPGLLLGLIGAVIGVTSIDLMLSALGIDPSSHSNASDGVDLYFAIALQALEIFTLAIAANYTFLAGFLFGLYLAIRWVYWPKAIDGGAWPALCMHCDYDLAGLTPDTGWWKCPECANMTPTRVRLCLGRWLMVFWGPVVEPHSELLRIDEAKLSGSSAETTAQSSP